MPKSLQDVAEVHYGKSQNGVADKYGDFPIIGTGGFLGYARKPLFSGPAIVVGRKGTLNNPIYSPDDFWAVDTTYAVVPKENIHPKWLYFTLKNARLELLNEATGVPSLSRDRLFRVPVQDVEFLEQTRIAYVLDTIDEAIARTEAVIAKLKQVRAGMLHDLLSYGLDEHGQLRDPVAHPEQFKDSPLGLIPREWDVCTLDSLGRWAGGKTPSKANSEFWAPGLTLWVTPKDVKDTEVVNTEDKLSRIGSSIMEIFPAGSLLVVGRSGILRHTLPVAIATSSFTINQDLKVLAPNRQDDEPIAKFLLLVLLSRDQDILRRCVKVGTTVESIDWKDFKNLLIGWPSKSERVRICNHIETFDRKLSLFSCELKKLTYFKYGLQDDLLIGRVRVPETIMEGAENA